MLRAARFLALVLAFSSPALAHAASASYMILFSQQNRTQDTDDHTFGVFFQTDGDQITDQATISWQPSSLKYDYSLLGLITIVPGTNFSLAQTLEGANNPALAIDAWGPYEIEPALFEKAKAQAAYLASGHVHYAIADLFHRETASDRILNCVHALSDVDVSHGYLDTGSLRGRDATHAVLISFLPYLVSPEITHPEFRADFGITKLPIDELELSDAEKARWKTLPH